MWASNSQNGGGDGVQPGRCLCAPWDAVVGGRGGAGGRGQRGTGRRTGLGQNRQADCGSDCHWRSCSRRRGNSSGSGRPARAGGTGSRRWPGCWPLHRRRRSAGGSQCACWQGGGGVAETVEQGLKDTGVSNRGHPLRWKETHSKLSPRNLSLSGPPDRKKSYSVLVKSTYIIVYQSFAGNRCRRGLG